MKTSNAYSDVTYSDVTKEQLITDLKVVMSDAEALIKATANQGGEALANVRVKAEESIAQAKAKMADIEEAVLLRSKAAMEATDIYVHENPWQAISIATGVGVLIGILISRR